MSPGGSVETTQQGETEEDRGKRGRVTGKMRETKENVSEEGSGTRKRGEERRVSLVRSLINVLLTGVTLMPPTHNPPPHISLTESHRKTWRASSSGYSLGSEVAAVVCPPPQVVTDDALVWGQ